MALLVEVVGFPYLLCWYFWATTGRVATDHLAVNAYMMGAFAVAVLAWSIARLRRAVSSATGGGFGVAAYALFARVLGETALSLVEVPWRQQLISSTGLLLMKAARYGGFIAFVFGLAMVLAACLSERSLRNQMTERVRQSRRFEVRRPCAPTRGR